MSQYILATRPVDGRHGRMEKVEGSGWRKRSLFTSLSNPATAEASKEMPYFILPSRPSRIYTTWLAIFLISSLCVTSRMVVP